MQPYHADRPGSARGSEVLRRAPGCPFAQIRGHVIRVRAPWVKANYFVNEDNYVLPNIDSVARRRPPARLGRCRATLALTLSCKA